MRSWLLDMMYHPLLKYVSWVYWGIFSFGRLRWGGGGGLLLGLSPVCGGLSAVGDGLCVWFVPMLVGGLGELMEERGNICRSSMLMMGGIF